MDRPRHHEIEGIVVSRGECVVQKTAQNVALAFVMI